MELSEIGKYQLNLINRIEKGIKYCDELWHKNKKCIRLIRKYDCETCDENKLPFCKVWRKIIELQRLYYISQIINLIDRFPILDEIPEKSKMRQQNLFKLRR